METNNDELAIATTNNTSKQYLIAIVTAIEFRHLH
ncbi:hypothetical protein NIES4106_01940 [Fischerella sp. NIES-4106]|nr:hypothetical protein NIES4106_01940 [Fischerella sp. NIES-4106]